MLSSRQRKEDEKVETGITERGQYDRKKRRDSAVDEEESLQVLCVQETKWKGSKARERDRGWLQVVGETGYGCHTFYITDVFRNIVIIADIRLLLCLNIVSCAHINMQFVIFNS